MPSSSRLRRPPAWRLTPSREAHEAELFYRELLGLAEPRRPLRGASNRFAPVHGVGSLRQAPFEEADGYGLVSSPWIEEQADGADGLPADDEETWAEFDAEFVEPDTSPNGAAAPFAPLISGARHWPIVTSHQRGRTVSYLTTDGAWIGRRMRSFGADRSGGRRYHIGVDLFGRFGDPVVAIEDGRIVRFFPFCCGDNKTSWALLVQHAQVVVNYGEVAPDSLSRNGLSVGSNVTAGQVIGRVGRNPGGSTMIHFETYTTGTRRSYRWMKGRPRPARILNPTRLLLDLQEQGLPRQAGGGAGKPIPPPARGRGRTVVHSCRSGEGPPAAVPDPLGRGLHPLVYRGTGRQHSRNPTVGDAQRLLNRFLSGLSMGTLHCRAGVDMASIQRIRGMLTQDPLAVDCRFGLNTEKATKMFQRCVFPGQPDQWDGKIGPATWRELVRLRVPPGDPSRSVTPGSGGGAASRGREANREGAMDTEPGQETYDPRYRALELKASSDHGGTRMSSALSGAMLNRIMPALAAQSSEIKRRYLDLTNEVFSLFAIDTIESRALFLAHAKVESDQYKFMVEADRRVPYRAREVNAQDRRWRPQHVTAQQDAAYRAQRYHRRPQVMGRGRYLYIGRGPLQVTTAQGYKRAVEVLNVWGQELGRRGAIQESARILRAAGEVGRDPTLASVPQLGFLLCGAFFKVALPFKSGLKSLDMRATRNVPMTAEDFLRVSSSMYGLGSFRRLRTYRPDQRQIVIDNLNHKVPAFRQAIQVLCGRNTAGVCAIQALKQPYAPLTRV